MLIILFDTQQQAQSKLDAINIQWMADYPNDDLFEKYADIIAYGGKFAIPMDYPKYFTQSEIASAVEYIEQEETIYEL